MTDTKPIVRRYNSVRVTSPRAKRSVKFLWILSHLLSLFCWRNSPKALGTREVPSLRTCTSAWPVGDCICSESPAGPFSPFISQRQEGCRHVVLSKKPVWPKGIVFFTLVFSKTQYPNSVMLFWTPYQCSSFSRDFLVMKSDVYWTRHPFSLGCYSEA